MIVNRLMYLAYYFKEIDRAKLYRFTQYVHKVQPRKRWKGLFLWTDILGASLRYNISILDYFYFRFVEIKDVAKRESFAGTGFLYEYQLKMNPRGKRDILANKILFLTRYKPFVLRKFLSLKDSSG